MFKIHKIWWSDISVRNLFLLFLTIVLGFASVVTLAEINIFSDISNAWQTIGRITITSDGSDTWTTGIDMSSSGIYINSNILDEQLIFSWRVLWIDETGNLIYAFSQNIVFSWASGSTIIMWSWDDDRTIVGNDIYTTHAAGNVGIGTSSMNGKLHIQGSAETEIYIEETNASNAANINLKNTMRTRGIWGDGSPDVFYIGQVGWPLDFIITPLGYIGIWTINPQEKLEVNGGNIRITNLANQIVLGTDSNGTIVGSTSGSIYNFISWFIQIIQGNTWATGAQWPQGIQGIPWVWSWTAWATGAQWPQGNTWATGAQWIQWPQGIQGNTWATGLLQAGILWATPFWNGSSRTTNNTNIFNTGWNVKIANMLEVSCGSYTNNKWIKIWNNSRIYDDACGTSPWGWWPEEDTLYMESDDSVAIKSNGNVGVFVKNTGKVWIGGITDPWYPLTVSGNSQFMHNINIAGKAWIGGIVNPIYALTVSGNSYFNKNLYTSGSVWIGTQDPKTMLHVKWQSMIDGNLIMTWGLWSWHRTIFFPKGIAMGNSIYGGLEFRVNNYTALSILANGNVWIGNVTPTYKLYVSGNVKISGDLTTAIQKICYVSNSTSWGDSSAIPVPPTWSAVDCSSYAGTVWKSYYWLGCIFEKDPKRAKTADLKWISYSYLQSEVNPVQNCGWYWESNLLIWWRTFSQCTQAGWIVINVAWWNICRFNQYYCPSTRIQHQDRSTTAGTTCVGYGEYGCFAGDTIFVPWHTRGNKEIEQDIYNDVFCRYPTWETCGNNQSCTPYPVRCSTTRTQIWCK